MTSIYRASELGGCTKAIIAKRLGYEPLATKEALEDIFREGDLHEEAVIAKLEMGGEPVSERQLEVNLIVGQCVVQGHLDGILDGRVLEIKSMGDEQFKAFERHRWGTPGLVQKYKWQISVYMLATGKEATVVIKNRNNGKTRREGVELPFYSLDEIAERVKDIEDWVAKGLLPGPCDTPQYPCPYYYLHEDKPLEADEVLDGLAEIYQDLQNREKRIKDQLADTRQQIRQALGDRTQVETPRIRVTVYPVTQKRYDYELMSFDGIDLEKYKIDQPQSERMRITLKEIDVP